MQLRIAEVVIFVKVHVRVFGAFGISSAAMSLYQSMSREPYGLFEMGQGLSQVTEDRDSRLKAKSHVRKYASRVMIANFSSTDRVDSSTARYFAPFAIKAQLAPRSPSATSSLPSSRARL